MPTITIIAGPNGAGKSTHSESILTVRGITSFDFDKEFDQAWKKYGYDPAVEAGVWNLCERMFLHQKEFALLNKVNFSYETNYNSIDVIETVTEFKVNGFSSELVFIALPTVEDAVSRVKDRVNKKGHSVDLETIHDRFEKGLQLLDESYKIYSSVTIYLSKDMALETLVHIEDVQKKIIGIWKEMPELLQGKLPRLTSYLRNYKRPKLGL